MDPELLAEGSALPYLASDHTTSVNSILPTFGQLNADGLFPVEGLDTPYVRVDLVNGVVRALPVTRGARPSTIARHEHPKGVIFEIPNVSHEDSIDAEFIRRHNALAARSRNPEESTAQLIERRHQLNRRKFDVTLEVLRLGALKGKITDGAGTELYDLYDVFNLTQDTIFFDLDNPNANVPAKIEELYGSIEDDLLDETMSGVEARVSREFYTKLISHPSIEKFFTGTPAMLELLNQRRTNLAPGVVRREINLGGVLFKEYRSQVTLWGADTPTRLLAPTEGYANPIGTSDSYATFAAPPIDIRVLDGGLADEGDLIHVTTEIQKHGMGEEWKYQMNALALSKRPGVNKKLSSAAS